MSSLASPANASAASSSSDDGSQSAVSASSSSSSSSESSLQTLEVGETCSYYARNRMSGCRWPRSCQSCLTFSGCMINSAGWCVSSREDAFEPDQDFQIGIDEGYALPNATANASLLALTQQWQFRAGKAKYCTSDDATCQSCVRQNFWRSRNSYPDSHFCVGADGCVCIDVCERRWYVRSQCPVVATPSPTPSVTTSSYYLTNAGVADRIWRGMVGVIIFTLLFLIVVIRQRKKAEARERAQRDERLRRQEARRQRRHDRAQSLGVNPLNLSGWETYRRDLIDKEKRQLSGADDEVARTTEGSESSGDESSDDDDEIRSPRPHGDISAIYVRMEETPVPSAPPAPTATMAHGAAAPTAQRDALPNLQVSAPIQRR